MSVEIWPLCACKYCYEKVFFSPHFLCHFGPKVTTCVTRAQTGIASKKKFYDTFHFMSNRWCSASVLRAVEKCPHFLAKSRHKSWLGNFYQTQNGHILLLHTCEILRLRHTACKILVETCCNRFCKRSNSSKIIIRVTQNKQNF